MEQNRIDKSQLHKSVQCHFIQSDAVINIQN